MGNKFDDRRKVPFSFFLTGILLLFLLMLSFALGEAGRDLLLRENGLVEGATVLGYFLCLSLVAYKGRIPYLWRGHAFVILITFFMLRELDFDKRFTTMGIFKSRFYASADVPLIEKGLALIILAILMYAVASIVHNHVGKFSLRTERSSTVSLGVLVVTVLLVVSKSLDWMGRKFQEGGYLISERMQSYAGAVEEILELGIPMIIFFSYICYFKEIENQRGSAAERFASTCSGRAG